MKRILLFLALIAASTLFAAAEYSFSAKADRSDAIYRKGEKATISFFFRDAEGGAVADRTVNYRIFNNGKRRALGTMKLSPQGGGTIDVSSEKAGWVFLEFTLPQAEKSGKPFVAGFGVMFSPGEFAAARPEPADFDEFWRKARAELRQLPFGAKLTPLASGNPGVTLNALELDAIGPYKVHAYFAKPARATAKSAPGVIFFQSAWFGDCNRAQAIHHAAKGALVLSVNAHGLPVGKPQEFYTAAQKSKEYAGCYGRNLTKVKESFLYFTILRCLRAIDYLKAQPEWDGKHLILCGGSFGGGQTIAATALEPATTLCVAGVPGLCDFGGGFAGRSPGWPKPYRVGSDGKAVPAEVPEQVDYLDGVNFARRIKCEVYTCTGFCDLTCVPTSVWTFYNTLPAGKKHILTSPGTGHGTRNRDGYARIDAYLREIKGK